MCALYVKSGFQFKYRLILRKFVVFNAWSNRHTRLTLDEKGVSLKVALLIYMVNWIPRHLIDVYYWMNEVEEE